MRVHVYTLVFLLTTVIPSLVVSWDWHCSFCHWGSGALISYNHRGHSQAEAISMVAEGCYMLDIYPKEVCNGMVANVGERLFTILDISNVGL